MSEEIRNKCKVFEKSVLEENEEYWEAMLELGLLGELDRKSTMDLGCE